MADLLFIWLDSAALLMFNKQQFYLFGQIHNSQTGGRPYSDTSLYGECSLVEHFPGFVLNWQSERMNAKVRWPFYEVREIYEIKIHQDIKASGKR